MAVNIQLNEEALIHLSEQAEADWKVSPMAMENIVKAPDGRVEDHAKETSYLFMHANGNIMFRKMNGIYQVSSITGASPIATAKVFCAVCDAGDITYTTLGFEPS